MKTYQPSFFDESERLDKLSKLGDPLVDLKKYIDFEQFRPTLEAAFARQKKSPAGRPPLDVVLMFKILILQRLYNMADEQVEYQINDRQSFQRFLGLHPGQSVPDYTSVWRFREHLGGQGTEKKLFEAYVDELEKQGVIAKGGTIVDASFVEVPRQRNSHEENEMIKSGQVPPEWEKHPRKLAQKDTQARWTQKNGQNYYGYKEHNLADAESKLVRDYEVTPANVHDSQVEMINESNAGENLFADSAYKSEAMDERLEKLGVGNYIHEKGARNRPLCAVRKKCNQIKSRIRVRIEHIYGHIENSMGGAGMEYIGLARIRTAVGLRNLAYNLTRYVQLVRLGRIVPGGGWKSATA